MSIDAAFGFQSQTTRALAAIDSTKYPDTNVDFQANIIRLNQFVDYIASYLQQMQKGIDKNNQDPIAQIQGTISDMVVLLGGGELLYGIDLGDLQYFLPAIGALFGFDTTTPFPINLFNAVEHFFLGYVVPLDSFSTVIEGIIDGWAVALGIDPAWIQAINDLLDAIGNLTMSIEDLLTSLESLLNIFGTDFPFISKIWQTITTILGGFSLAQLGAIIDPTFTAVAPWIEELATAVNDLTSIIESFANGINDVSGILNFSSLFSNLNFLPSGTFNPIQTISDWFTGTVSQTNVVSLLSQDLTGGTGMGVTGVIPLENLAMDAIGGIVGGAQSLIDAILYSVGVPAGSGTTAQVQTYFSSFLSMFNNPALITTPFNPLTAVTNFINGLITQTNLVPIMNAATGLIKVLNIPGLDASKITTGQFAQSMVNITNIPANIVSGVLAAANIPGLDASKIISGQFAQSMVNITNIPANIVTGVLNAVNIPGLDASKIISGVFTVPQIPPLDASQIVSGAFGQWILPLIPVSSVGNTNPNLLPNPNYATASSVTPNAYWVWVSTPDHTGDGSGSVRCLGDGNNHSLLSDPPTQVSAGQVLACSHYLEWSGVAGSGACFQLSVLAYSGSSLVGPTVLQTISNPAASSGWVQLSGTYTVPSSGVDNIRLELQLLPGCTAGTTYWDDGSITKTQLLQQPWIAGTGGTLLAQLNTMITNISASALQTDLISLVNNLGGGSFANVGASLSAITTRFQGLAAATGIIAAPFVAGLDATKIISGVLSTASIPPITAAMAAAPTASVPGLAKIDDVVNGIFNPTTPVTGNAVSVLQNALQTIPHVNVIPVSGLGGTDIGGTIQAHVDAGVQAIVGGTSTGNPVSTYQQALNNAIVTFLGYTPSGTPTPGSIAATAQANNQALMNTAIYGTFGTGVDPSTDGPFRLETICWNGSLPNMNLTSAASAIAFIPTPNGGVVQSIRWLYIASGTITGFYVTVYKLNSDGTSSPIVYTSGDIHTSIATGGSTPLWFSLNLPSGSYFTTHQGDSYTVEFILVGSGTMNIVGMYNYLPPLPGAVPPKFGASRSGAVPPVPSSLPAIGATGGPAVATPQWNPWVGFAGSAGQTQYPPQLVPIYSNGNYDPTQFPWANYYDVIIAGAGGSGCNGGPGGGYGGNAASWNGVTLTKAQAGTSQFQFTIGQPGGASATGGTTQVYIPNTAATYSAGGGSGATSQGPFQIGKPGADMPQYQYNDVHGNPHYYAGGSGGGSPQAGGGQPGAGGAGGNSVAQGQYIYGGPGGPGIGYVLAYQ